METEKSELKLPVSSVSGIAKYPVLPEKRNLKLLKSQNINVNWYMYCPEGSVILLSTTVLGNVLQPFYFRAGTMSKLPKFETELPAAPKSTKLSLSERDIAMATIYGQLYVLFLRHHSQASNSAGAEVVLYHLPQEGACKKMHILKLNRTGKFALNVVDNLVVVHHQDTETSVIFDIKLRGEFDGSVILHHPVLPARSIQPYQIPAAVLTESDRATLSVIATIFDKLNQEYKKYPDTEQLHNHPSPSGVVLFLALVFRAEAAAGLISEGSLCSQHLGIWSFWIDCKHAVIQKTTEILSVVCVQAMEAGQSRSGPLLRRPVRTQAVVDHSDMYTHVLSVFTEKKETPHKFVIAVLMEYIRSLNQFQITVQHYLHELVIRTLVQHSLFSTLHQLLQYHVLSDSKPLRLSTANDEIVEVLLSKHQVLAALRFIRGIGGHDNISAWKFLDAAKQSEDHMLFYTIFQFFQQRNQRLRGNPSFTPGKHCEEHVAFFKQVFGDQALMRPTTF
ncbi:regulator of MON1-CCZ1 complex-like [Budorcas taxicolor]|uniref:regulator of MON1-CCZ1 complex-like n=1 Tax=Budorcas taxicolor TaxID=37181 RepID=UPI002283D395|nr:regulator of MON1-CCZ1 complex-like [Budorcas taxicolor]